jgi:hypothetical protein
VSIEQIEGLCEFLNTARRDLSNRELSVVLNEHLPRLVATIDIEGEPFHSVDLARLSEPREGREPRIILWLDPTKLDDEWKPDE